MSIVRAAGTTSAAGLRRRRTAAMLALAEHPELSPSLLAELQASQVRQSNGQGEIFIRIELTAALLLVRLTRTQQEALLDYLEAARLWGEPARLFPSRRAIVVARQRRRRRRAP